MGRSPFDGQRDRQQHEAAGHELPRGEGEQGNRPPPALGQHDPAGHRRRPGEPGEHAGAVEGGAGAEHEQGDTGDAEGAGDDHPGPDALAQEHRAQPGGDQGLHGAEGGGDATGEPVGGDEQQGEEAADVEGAEHQRPTPPAAHWPPLGDRGEGQAGGQRPQHPGEQRAARREELGGDQVGRPPCRRCQRRGEDDLGGGGCPSGAHGSLLLIISILIQRYLLPRTESTADVACGVGGQRLRAVCQAEWIAPSM
jgi:hypothetical protein